LIFGINIKAEEEEDLVDPATHIKETCAEAHCSAVRAKLGMSARHP
jgi:hypothetical protein